MDKMVLRGAVNEDVAALAYKLQNLDYIDDYDTSMLVRMFDEDEAVEAMNQALFTYVREEEPKFFPCSIAESEKRRLAREAFEDGDVMYSIGVELRDFQLEDILEMG